MDLSQETGEAAKRVAEVEESQEALSELEVQRLGPAVPVSQEWVEDAGVGEALARIEALLERMAAPRGLLANDDLIELENYEPSPEEKARAEGLVKRELAQRLIQWASIKESLEHVEGLIREQVLALGHSVTVGDVTAVYLTPSDLLPGRVVISWER
jgi:hypothetical protein